MASGSSSTPRPGRRAGQSIRRDDSRPGAGAHSAGQGRQRHPDQCHVVWARPPELRALLPVSGRERSAPEYPAKEPCAIRSRKSRYWRARHPLIFSPAPDPGTSPGASQTDRGGWSRRPREHGRHHATGTYVDIASALARTTRPATRPWRGRRASRPRPRPAAAAE